MAIEGYRDRLLDLRPTLAHKSVFLFGPRQTGKSTLVKHAFPDAATYSLLESDTFLALSARPSLQMTTGDRSTLATGSGPDEWFPVGR
jgi:hypothetical protein